MKITLLFRMTTTGPPVIKTIKNVMGAVGIGKFQPKHKT